MKMRLFTLLVLTCIIINSQAEDGINIYIDVSGSVAGKSSDRSYDSFNKIREELNDFLPNYLSSGKSVRLITFTDSVISELSICTEKTIEINAIVSNILPHKGNSNIIGILKNINNDDINVLISDGLDNTPLSRVDYEDYLKSTLGSHQNNLYMLRIDQNDDNITTVQFNNHDRLLNSLRDLIVSNPPSDIQNEIDVNNEAVTSSAPVESKNISDNDHIDGYPIDYKLILWTIITIIIVALLADLIIKASPLIFNSSAAAMQSAICWLYNLPKPLHYIIRSLCSFKMKKFLSNNMVSYSDYKRGTFIPNSDQQREAAEAFKKLTGRYPRYKNGEIDFSPIAKHKIKLENGLDNVIPKGKDVRKNVHKAQEYAADQMIKSKEGRKKIADYLGISPDQVKDYEQFRKWKDDELRRGTTSFNPLTPHETSDGREILYVPKRFHDVAWGGISHTGGVSMLSRIREVFDI